MQPDQPQDADQEDSLGFDDLGREAVTPVEDDTAEEGLSLEELRQSYTSLIDSSNDASAEETPTEPGNKQPEANENPETEQDPAASAGNFQIGPVSILEALLFVGHPDNSPITAREIAGLMRGIEESDVPGLIEQLNEVYAQSDRALVAEETSHGYRMTIADDLSDVRERFYGRIRTIALNQTAIDCLALIAYQPGISRQQLEEQRGQASGSVLNQLVRRQLIEVHREGTGKQSTVSYYPTDKLLKLAGLASLDDLPQVEEFD